MIHFQPFQPTLAAHGLKKFALAIRTAEPCAALRPLVHSYLQVTASAPSVYPVIPDGTQALFLGPQGIRFGGAFSHTVDLYLGEKGEYFGIRFQAGALKHLKPFSRLSLLELQDQLIPADEVLPLGFDRLQQQVYEASQFSEKVSLCQSFFLRHYEPQPSGAFEQALACLIASNGNIQISELSRHIGCSSRHLNRLFCQYTGLNSKTFAQILRLQQVCKTLFSGSANPPILLDGFFDQSHLHKEFSKRLFTTPRGFVGRFMSDFYNS